MVAPGPARHALGVRGTQERWAPWWVYVVLGIGCNVVKQRLLAGAPAVVNIAVTVVMVAVLVVVVTAVHRATGPSR